MNMHSTGRFILLMALLTLFQTVAADLKPRSLTLYVDADARPGGKGSLKAPYDDVDDAIERARIAVTEGYNVTVHMAPGTYLLRKTLHVDVPVHLQGSNVVSTDAEGWPEATPVAGTETVMVPETCEQVGGAFQPVLKIGTGSGESIRGVTVNNITVRGIDARCTAVSIQRTQDLHFEDTIVRGPALTGIDLSESSGVIEGNNVSGIQACGICVSAGTSDSPAIVTVQDNRSSANIGGGVLLGGTTFPLLDIGNGVTAHVIHNDLSYNTAPGALGFGLRILAIGQVAAETGLVEGVVTADIADNHLLGNRNSIMIDAGFAQRSSPTGVCDSRTFSARYDLSFDNNTLSGSIRKAVLLSFTRGQIYTGNNATNNNSRWQYLHASTFSVNDPDNTLALGSAVVPTSNTDIPTASIVLDHPANDRFVGGSCADDVAPAEALENTLIYNGQVVPATPN